MIVSGDIKHVCGSAELIQRRRGETDGVGGDNAFDGAIPRRYRNERGGVDLERVRQDQQEARRQVLRSMIQSLVTVWRRR